MPLKRFHTIQHAELYASNELYRSLYDKQSKTAHTA
jgi:ABC-type multidrug transport system fused ATPase/permease subunit